MAQRTRKTNDIAPSDSLKYTAPQRKATETPASLQLTQNQLVMAGFGIMALIGLLQYLSPVERELRALKSDQRIATRVAEIEAKQSQQLTEIANQRYAQGCSMAYKGVPDAQGYYREIVPLSEGMVIMSANGDRPLSDGQLVCDHLFMTYEIVNGVTANPARADDEALVLKRFGAYAQWHPEARRGAIIQHRQTISQES